MVNSVSDDGKLECSNWVPKMAEIFEVDLKGSVSSFTTFELDHLR